MRNNVLLVKTWIIYLCVFACVFIYESGFAHARIVRDESQQLKLYRQMLSSTDVWHSAFH